MKEKTTWESAEVSAEQLSQEQDANKESLAGILNLYAESRAVMREKIGRMTDDEVVELADMCLDELENREYSVLRVCMNVEKEDSPYTLDVVGNVGQIASSLTYLCAKSEGFAKCVLAVAKTLQEQKEEIVAAIEEAEEE